MKEFLPDALVALDRSPSRRVEKKCKCSLLCFDMAAELGRCCAMALLPLSLLTALLLAMRLMDEFYIVEHLEVIFRTDASPSSRSFNSNYMLLGSQGNNSGIHSLCGSLAVDCGCDGREVGSDVKLVGEKFCSLVHDGAPELLADQNRSALDSEALAFQNRVSHDEPSNGIESMASLNMFSVVLNTA